MKDFVTIIQYQFKQPLLLEMALTHRSVAGKNNERLEFLGDSILNFVIAYALFQRFPYATEGELSRLRANLVNENSLAEIAQDFNLGDYLRLGPGEMKSGGARRKSILADALEAVIGAIYLDADMMVCQSLVLQWFATRFQETKKMEHLKDAKSRLQEFLQSRKYPLPNYAVISVVGEAHAQCFHVSCTVAGLDHQTEGMSTTRRGAEQIAAEAFLVWLEQQ